MHLKRKLPWILTGKSLLAVTSITMVALALVTYTATVTIFVGGSSFTLGASTQNWDVYVNDINQFRYLPGSTATPRGSLQLTPGSTAGNNAFSVTNDGAQGTGVQIDLSTLMPTSQFTMFQITVGWWNATSGAWATNVTITNIFTTLTGSTTIPVIQGLTGGSGPTFGFLHIPKTQITAAFFEIIVFYTTAASATGSTAASFVYTPTRTASY